MAYHLQPFRKGIQDIGAEKSRTRRERLQLKRGGVYLGYIIVENGTISRFVQCEGASNLTEKGFKEVARRELARRAS